MLGMVVEEAVVVVVGMGVVVRASGREDKDHKQGGGAVSKRTSKETGSEMIKNDELKMTHGEIINTGTKR